MIRWIFSLFKRNRGDKAGWLENPETKKAFIVVDIESKNHGSRNGYDGTYNVPNPLSAKPFPTLIAPPEEIDLNKLPAGTQSPYFGPNPFAQIYATYPAELYFSCSQMNGSMTQHWRASVGFPTFYVETKDGHITYMVSADGPKDGIKLIAGWRLYKSVTAIEIHKYANVIAEWLLDRAQKFTSEIPPLKKMEEQIKNALTVQSLDEVKISIKLSVLKGKHMDGQKLWHAMHDLGFEYGAHEFVFNDPFDEGDSLISCSAYDSKGNEPYLDDIEEGNQNFESLIFYFNGLRTRSPAYVLKLIDTATKELQTEFGGKLEFSINDKLVNSLDVLEEAISETVRELSKLNLKAGSSAVKMLR